MQRLKGGMWDSEGQDVGAWQQTRQPGRRVPGCITWVSLTASVGVWVCVEQINR